MRGPADIGKIISLPTDNYAVLPTAGSGLLIIDLDDARLLDDLGDLSNTLVVRTGRAGGGFHIYGRLPDGVAEADVPRSFAGGEVRVAGSGCCVGPFSRHASGAIYEPVGDVDQVGVFSASTLAAITSMSRPDHGPATRDPAVGAKVAAGRRHTFLRDQAFALRKKGLHGGPLRAAVEQLNADLCLPPMSAAEVLNAIGSVERVAADPAVERVDDPEPWAAPVPLPSASALPSFPVHALPRWLGEMVQATAMAIQVPLDLPAMLALAVLAVVCAGRVIVKVTADWTEPVNLYVAVAMPPGARKSPTHRTMTAPLVERERLLVDDARPALAIATSRRKIAERRLADLEKIASRAEPDARIAAEVEVEAAATALATMIVPVEPRLMTTDATPEAVGRGLHEQQGVLSVLSDEGGIFDHLAGRYSNGIPNIDNFLKAWAGDTIRVDRIGRPTNYVEHPALTIAVTVQPFVLAKAGRVPELSARGLLDRFLYAMPADSIGYRLTDAPEIPPATKMHYHERVLAMASRLAHQEQCLRLSETAWKLLQTWRSATEVRRRPSGNLGPIQGWAAKLDGQVIRIAALIHEAAHDGLDGGDVDSACLAAAIEIADYLTAHAVEAFRAMRGDPRLDPASRVLGWIRSQGREEFSRRECHRALIAMFPKATDLAPVLESLVERDYIRLIDTIAGPGRPSARYTVSPHVWLTELTEREEGVGNGSPMEDDPHREEGTMYPFGDADDPATTPLDEERAERSGAGVE